MAEFVFQRKRPDAQELDVSQRKAKAMLQDNRKPGQTGMLDDGRTAQQPWNVTQQPIQRMSLEELSVLKKHELKSRVNGWTEEGSYELYQWATSWKQFNSVRQNMEQLEWHLVKKQYPSGDMLPIKIAAIRKKLGQKPGDDRKLQQLASDATPRTGMRMGDLVTAQQAYENAFISFYHNNNKALMDKNRTMGIEFEFAQLNKDVDAHMPVATNKTRILKSIPGSWELETDSNNKLEIGVPPILIPDLPGGKINAAAVGNAYALVRNELAAARDSVTHDSYIKDFAEQTLPAHGFGKGAWTYKFSDQQLAFRSRKKIRYFGNDQIDDALGLDYSQGSEDSSARNKYMYGQVNLTMTPKELAEHMESNKKLIEGGHKEVEQLIVPLHESIYHYITNDMGWDKGSLKVAATLLSKSLANLGAMPSILEKTDAGYQSAIKEVYSIWIKSNTPDLIASALGEHKSLVKSSLDTSVKRAKKKKRGYRAKKVGVGIGHAQHIGFLIRDAIEKHVHFAPNSPEKRNLDKNEKLIIGEIISTLRKIENVISTGMKLGSPPTGFGNERFDNQHGGYGVRKDTYVDVTEGNERPLALGEFRSEWGVNRMLDLEQNR